mgnify:FL=1
MAKRILVDFDSMSYACPYSTSSCEYDCGCCHPDADEAELDPKSGNLVGRCWNSGCPVACGFDEEDLDNPDLDWDGTEREDVCGVDGEFIDDGEYATLCCDDTASPDERRLLYHYQRYMHRYDSEWLKTHEEEEFG